MEQKYESKGDDTMRNNLTIPTTIETIPSYVVAEMMDKKHYEVLTMIQGTSDRRGIIDILGDLQMEVSEFFIESTYVSSQNKEVKCYECTRMGCDMLANKMTGDKGMIFTAKYVKAFNDMKQQLIAQKPLALPSYSFSNYWIKREIGAMKPTDIPQYVEDLITHVATNKPQERLTTYQITQEALAVRQSDLTEAWQREMVQASLNDLNKRIELQKTYINRSRLGQATKKNNQLKETIRHYELDSYDNYYYVDIHGFTINKSYCGSKYDDKIHCTKTYKDWKDDAEVKTQDLPSFEEMGLNPKAYKKLDIYFYLKDSTFDVNNCAKSFLDALQTHYRKTYPEFNDNQFADVRTRKYFSYSETYENGFIAFGIKDMTQEEIDNLTFDDDEE